MERFWENKTVLITGANGFKGSWLSIWLSNLGAKVVGLSKHVDCTSNIFDNINNNILNFYGDINDDKLINFILSESNPDIIIHMAAQPLVLASYLDPHETMKTNVLGTNCLLKELYELKKQGLKTKVFLNVTTDKVYKNKEWIWGYRETDQLGGLDPYSCSKACSEMVTEMYARSFFKDLDISFSTVRAGNVVGGGDWSENRLIPDCIKSFVSDCDISIRFPNSIRPWQHVIEPLAGYMLLAESMYKTTIKFDSWNFGTNQSVTVKEVVDILFSLWKKNDLKTKVSPSLINESNLLKLDSHKSAYHLGWSNIFTINEVMRYTVEWYEAYFYKNQKSESITLEQLRLFSSKFNKESLIIN
ncbi:CDP-glucose 4,6-dehydratase [Providencia stuartii]|uniref:CDP-glucose 4,6-dehydratase n=1 Tax=Providencia stuartii TaxID=588 RepID=UPI00300C69E8